MACASISFSPPTLPSIFLPNGFALTLSLGQVGVTCCHYTIPTVRVAVPIPLPAAALAVVAATVNASIAQLMATLRQVQIPSCPTE